VVARLEVDLDSYYPGPVRARVLRNVYDSRSGREVIIPAGALLLGASQNQLAYGEDRMLVAFEQVTWPGETWDLPQLPSLEASGQLGLQDKVNRHYFSTLGRAIALGLVGAGLQISQERDRSPSEHGYTNQEIAAASVSLELGRVAQEVIRQGLSRRPRVRVRQGERFYVYLNGDLKF
jgi:type IV secretion system protein VirB10